MSRAEAPVALFDSGVGGLSVWREVARQLPDETILYLADQAHLPYGPRPLAEVRRYARGIARFLLDEGAKLIVVACNTASAAALHHLRMVFPDVPFVGMEPAVKPAVERTRSGQVGVIATPATFQGELFRRLVERFAANVELHTQVCPGLVEAVERGEFDSPRVEGLLHRYLDPMVDAGIDQLVLGCTHYPFLERAIRRVVGEGVALIDPAPAVARQVGRVLAARGWLARRRDGAPKHRFYSTGDASLLAEQAARLVGYRGEVRALRWVEERYLACRNHETFPPVNAMRDRSHFSHERSARWSTRSRER